MCEKRKISVEIPGKSYNIIRRLVESENCKTSRILSRYLFTYLKILSIGEKTLKKKFTRKQAMSLYYVLRRIHHVDEISWDELVLYPAYNLSKLVELFDESKNVPVALVASLNSWEMFALIEYAQTEGSVFEAHTAEFVS